MPIKSFKTLSCNQSSAFTLTGAPALGQFLDLGDLNKYSRKIKITLVWSEGSGWVVGLEVGTGYRGSSMLDFGRLMRLWVWPTEEISSLK